MERTTQLILPFHRGFTLAELVTGLAVLSLLSIGAFAMREFSRRQVLTTEVNTLISHLNLARSEAVTRKVPVAVCGTDDGVACNRSDDWQHGYIVFADTNRNNRRENDEPLIHIATPAKGISLQWCASGFSRRNLYIAYQPTGFTGKNGTFLLCDASTRQARAIAVIHTGRARIKIPTRQERERCSS